MNPGDSTWTGRKKHLVRRFAFDLRLLLPFIALAGCYAVSVTAIVASERLPLASVTTPELPAVSAPRAGDPKCKVTPRPSLRTEAPRTPHCD